MTARQVRSLDQRIADTRRELEALEAKKREREDKTLKSLASMKRKLESFPEASTDEDVKRVIQALGLLETSFHRALRAELGLP